MLGRIARLAAATMGAALMIGALAAPVLGAQAPLTMDVLIDDFCVQGTAKPDTVIKIVIRDSTGNLKGREAFMSQADGFWSGCVDFFADGFTTGDSIKVTDYDTNQHLNYTIPRLTMSVNRVT